ncbi:MAG: acyl-CoA dehydrogenase family protein, partial [Pseudomonadales bacterium]
MHALSATMSWSEEQSMLLDTATNFFRDKSTVPDVRRQIETETGFDSEIWQEIVDLGWTGLAIPEQFGGSGLGLAAAVSIAEPMGRQLFASPFQSTQLAIQALLAGSETQRTQWLSAFTGQCIGTVAMVERNGDWDLRACECSISIRGETALLTGTKTFVLDAPAADIFVVSARCDGAPAVVIVPSSCIPAGALTRQTVIDQTRRSYELRLDGIEVPAANLIRG